MSKRVYALRILVETDKDMETVESHVRGWGEATFEGFILLELTRTQASLANIDTLTHTVASMVKAQEATQRALERTTDAFRSTVEVLKHLVGTLSVEKRPDKDEEEFACQAEEPETEEARSNVSTEEV